VAEARPAVFRQIGPNTLGRDFVVGDIHGAFDLVIKGMREVGFNQKADRLFCVGDLIDRGAGSARVLEFLAQPYVYAVRGNHDDDYSSMSIETIRALGHLNWNGLSWTKVIEDEKLLAIKDRLATLPIAMQIQTARGSVGLVHGDVPAGMSWPGFVAALWRGDENVIAAALTGRDRIKRQDASGVAGIDRLFVGHSVQWGGPTRLGNVFAIDTGAVFREIDSDRGALTMANLVCQTAALCVRRRNVRTAPTRIHSPHPGRWRLRRLRSSTCNNLIRLP